MLTINRTKCCYCGTCVAVCPQGNLELVDACLEWVPECALCGICAKICPVGAIEVEHENRI